MPIDSNFPVKLVPPPCESEITRTWGDSRKPVVSICCPTYNHAGFIRDAINSFLAQKTDFRFEIVIRDDASTDGTTDIVRDYVQRYPNIVRVAVETENRFSKGVRALHVWPSLATGELIALCEGDDFWTDAHKLQKQVDLLRQYPEAVMSVAMTDVYQQEGETLRFLTTFKGSGKTLHGFEENRCHYFHTSTFLIRGLILREVVEKYLSGHCLFGDVSLRAILVTYGPLAFLPKVTSVYRITGTGIWTGSAREKQLAWETEIAEKLESLLTGKHKRWQQEKLFSFYKEAIIANVRAGRVIAGAQFLPRLIRYSAAKTLGHITRKMNLSNSRSSA